MRRGAVLTWPACPRPQRPPLRTVILPHYSPCSSIQAEIGWSETFVGREEGMKIDPLEECANIDLDEISGHSLYV